MKQIKQKLTVIVTLCAGTILGLGLWLVLPVRANNVARKDIMHVEKVWDRLGIYGKGQIVGIADTGLDSGELNSIHPDFSGRVIKTFALGRTDDWSDSNGHGTHVSGSVLGNGKMSGSDPEKHNYGNSITGAAPEASLVFQSLLDNNSGLGGLPNDLSDLFQQSYDAGARIHTNSWGANFFIAPLARFTTSGDYPKESTQTDRFMWEHKDMVILFAAGNSGNDVLTEGKKDEIPIPIPDGIVDHDSIGSPGTAKNVITVGASESVRSTGGNSDSTWGNDNAIIAYLNFNGSADPIYSDKPSDNANGIAAFSSRGPTDDGRIKPDVVAPGTNILSTQSQDPDASEMYGLYENNKNYSYSSGTSMATPLVAGAVTLIRQWYIEKRDHPQPTAALIKATLINGAVDISPGQYGTGDTQEIPDLWPNNVIGWGRVDLAASIAPGGEREIWFDDSGIITNNSDTVEIERYIASGDEPVRITLVWTDPPYENKNEGDSIGIDIPGLTKEVKPVLINDLDLEVTTPNNRTFLGNGERDSLGEADRLNNVEAIRIPNPKSGIYTIKIIGYNIAQDEQPYAIVIAGDNVVSGKKVGASEKDTTTKKTRTSSQSNLVMFLIIGGGVIVVLIVGIMNFQKTPQQTSRNRGKGNYKKQPRSWGVLTVQSGDNDGERIPLFRNTIVIGRSSKNDVTLQGSKVSRKHARIEQHSDGYYLIDMNSANGVFVHNKRLTTGYKLHNGDSFRIGNITMVFNIK